MKADMSDQVLIVVVVTDLPVRIETIFPELLQVLVEDSSQLSS